VSICERSPSPSRTIVCEKCTGRRSDSGRPVLGGGMADDGGAPSPTDAAPMLWGTRVSAVGEQPAPRRLSPRAAQIDTSMHISALASSTHFFTYRASALLKAAAAHRTFVEHCLGDQQLVRGSSGSAEQLAELMDQQMTGEEAIEVAISLGMPRPSTRF